MEYVSKLAHGHVRSGGKGGRGGFKPARQNLIVSPVETPAVLHNDLPRPGLTLLLNVRRGTKNELSY